jgi:geranylgeranyl pyrophosphate synthase
MLDAAAAREGHAPAHVIYGRARTLVAIPLAFGAIAEAVVRHRDLRPRERAAWVARGLVATLEGTWGLRPALGSCTPEAYARRWGLAVGKPVEWALLAALSGRLDRPTAGAVRRYAHAHGINRRIANDIADYCRADGESEARFSDLLAGRMTLPALVLLREPLTAPERAAVLGHFGGAPGRRLRLEEAVRPFVEHRVFERCLRTMEHHERTAAAAAADLERACPEAAPLARFLRRWEAEYVARSRADVEQALTAPPFAKWDYDIDSFVRPTGWERA